MAAIKTAEEMNVEQELCWLCGGEGADTTVVTERETPGGKQCPPKDVRVHFGCLMDMDA